MKTPNIPNIFLLLIINLIKNKDYENVKTNTRSCNFMAFLK